MGGGAVLEGTASGGDGARCTIPASAADAEAGEGGGGATVSSKAATDAAAGEGGGGGEGGAIVASAASPVATAAVDAAVDAAIATTSTSALAAATSVATSALGAGTPTGGRCRGKVVGGLLCERRASPGVDGSATDRGIRGLRGVLCGTGVAAVVSAAAVEESTREGEQGHEKAASGAANSAGAFFDCSASAGPDGGACGA